MKKQTGFTLIELMITVFILGILAAIAIPNYQSYVRRTHCEDAKATLMGAANLMERYRAQKNTYTDADLGSYAKSPIDGSTKQFTIAISASTATTYTLTATPSGMLSGTGTLTIKSTGERGATGKLSTINAWSSCSGI
ncbi:type IV pilin protein [Pseudomonas sp. Marseille-Q8238]